MHPRVQEGKAYRMAEAGRVQKAKDAEECRTMQSNINLLYLTGGGKVKPPPGWEWAEKLKHEQEAVNGKRR